MRKLVQIIFKQKISIIQFCFIFLLLHINYQLKKKIGDAGICNASEKELRNWVKILYNLILKLKSKGEANWHKVISKNVQHVPHFATKTHFPFLFLKLRAIHKYMTDPFCKESLKYP